MKIGFTTYPTALQHSGGLQVHIKQTLEALRKLGLDVEIVDLYHHNLADYDLIHHFSLNHASFRILQATKSFKLPCVVTPMVEPVQSWWRLRKIQALVFALRSIFGYEFRNRWQDTIDGLEAADAITPITDTERRVIEFLAPTTSERITVIPNGVTDDFFTATPEPFFDNSKSSEPFVLLPSSIQPYKNQLPVILEASRLGYRTVMIGPIADRDYFQACLNAGADRVEYRGVLDYPSPELTSMFAAAGIVVLASKIECFGLVPFEALAAGTPAVLTKVSGLKTPAKPPYFQRVDPDDTKAIAEAIEVGMKAHRDRATCQALVETMRWSNVATQLRDVYEQVKARS